MRFCFLIWIALENIPLQKSSFSALGDLARDKDNFQLQKSDLGDFRELAQNYHNSEEGIGEENLSVLKWVLFEVELFLSAECCGPQAPAPPRGQGPSGSSTDISNRDILLRCSVVAEVAPIPADISDVSTAIDSSPVFYNSDIARQVI